MRIRSPADQSALLAWAFSLFAGVIAVFYTFAALPHLSWWGAAIASIVAFLCAWLAGKIANRFGASRFGLIAGAIMSFMFSLIFPTTMFFLALALDLQSATQQWPSIGLIFAGIYIGFVIAIGYAVPAAIVATILFNVIIRIITLNRGLSFQQRWL